MPEEETATATIALTMDVLAPTDIAAMQITVERVSCEGEEFEPGTWTAVKTLEDFFLPGDIPAFINQPFDEDSVHIFADHYFLLPAGCYDAEIVPLAENREPSELCYAARKTHIEVYDGLTSEVLLISQCIGPARGGLDVVAAVNHPPTIIDHTFNPSKFVSECEAVEICTTAIDPDADPLEFTWEQTGGPGLLLGPTVSSMALNEDGSVTQCVVISTGEVDNYEFLVTVFDLGYDEDGQITRMEALLAEQEEAYESRDTLEFPVYASVECPGEGRSVAIVMTMSNRPGLTPPMAGRLAANSVRWTNPNPTIEPRILVVLDNNHNGEQAFDALFVRNLLVGAGFGSVAYMVEPAGGLDLPQLLDYDVVWFSNPGFPLNEVGTYNALLGFRDGGGGLILQGDDITRFDANRLPMEPFTYSTWVSNGTSTCGHPTDNNAGWNYLVEFDPPTTSLPHPVIDGLEGARALYGNDIDHSIPLGLGEEVLAIATLAQDESCDLVTSAVIAIDPAMIITP
jgi:hypothetical protein